MDCSTEGLDALDDGSSLFRVRYDIPDWQLDRFKL